MPIFNSMFQMVLRRLIRQTRRLLHGRKWSKSLSTGVLVYCITAQFLHRPLPRGNACAVIKSPNPTFYLCSIHISCTELLRLWRCTGVQDYPITSKVLTLASCKTLKKPSLLLDNESLEIKPNFETQNYLNVLSIALPFGSIRQMTYKWIL